MKREFKDLWIAVGILLAAIAYHVAVSAFGWTGTIVKTDLALAITSGLFFWLVGMLWIAYMRWQKASSLQSNLYDVFCSTGQEVVAVVDASGTVVMCNEALQLVFGYQEADLVGQRVSRLYQPSEKGRESRSEIQQALREIGFHQGEALGRHQDGREMVLEISVANRKNLHGRVYMIRDITERKHAEQLIQEAMQEARREKNAKEEALQQLEASYQRLRELEVHRDNLVHMVCHDMKAPIQVLMLQLDLLKDMVMEKLDNNELESVDSLLVYTRQLEIMVNSMLDVSKFESGKMPLVPREVEVDKVLEDAVQFIRAVGKGRMFPTEVLGQSRKCLADPDVVSRVLINLLLNAVKNSGHHSPISIAAHYTDDHLRIEVTDRGVGIPEEFQECIFEKFEQVNLKDSRRAGSIGLGLTFCRLAVEAHGGVIGVRSAEGEGSTFWFVLPYSYDFPEVEPRFKKLIEHRLEARKVLG